MQLKAVLQGPFLEVPNDDICLEAHEGALATGDVLAIGRDSDDGDLIVVASEEGLLAGEHVPDDDGGAQWVDEMFVVRMQNESVSSGACRKPCST